MSITITAPAAGPLDAKLAKIDFALRGTAIRKSLNSLGAVVVKEAQRRVVRGDTRHNPEAKALHDTIGKVHRVKDTGSAPVHFMVVGAMYPAGAHAHLVEGWKDKKRVIVSRGPRKGQSPLGRPGMRAVAKPFMAPAVDATKTAQIQAFMATLNKEVEAANG